MKTIHDVRAEVERQLPKIPAATLDSFFSLPESVAAALVATLAVKDVTDHYFDSSSTWAIYLDAEARSPSSNTNTVDAALVTLAARSAAAVQAEVESAEYRASVESKDADSAQQRRIDDFRFRNSPPVEVLRSATPLPEDVFTYSTPSKLIAAHLHEKPFVIESVLRRGEVMSLIAPPKTGKSWIVHDLALSVIHGRKWLDTYHTKKGKVTLVDNELSRETLSQRFRAVAAARFNLTDWRELDESLSTMALRGYARNVFDLGTDVFGDGLDKDTRLVILDSLYEFYWIGFNENSNADMARLVNVIKGYATKHNVAVVFVHHSSKGSQAGKDAVDVGAGAGALARAVDTHCALRWSTSALIRRMEQPGSALTQQTLLKPELIVRESCGARSGPAN